MSKKDAQTKYQNLYVFEIKFSRNAIGSKIIDEVNDKIKRLSPPKGIAVLPILVHVNGVSEAILEKEYFYSIIDFADLIK